MLDYNNTQLKFSERNYLLQIIWLNIIMKLFLVLISSAIVMWEVEGNIESVMKKFPLWKVKCCYFIVPY